MTTKRLPVQEDFGQSHDVDKLNGVRRRLIVFFFHLNLGQLAEIANF